MLHNNFETMGKLHFVDNRIVLTRQKSILRLISNAGGCIGKTRLHKLAFVLRDEVPGSPTSQVYQFVPYHFGPYSFTMNHDLKKLESEGFVRISDKEIHISDHAGTLPAFDKQLTTAVDTVSKRFASVKTDVLVSTVYSRYPWYTSNARDRSKRRAAIPMVSCAVFTVGYEGLMLDGLLDLLLKNGIKRLIDVRANPVARQFGFHKSTLLRHCLDLSVEYVHIPELGITSENRADLNGKSAYDKLFSHYESETLASETDAVELAMRLVMETPSALMCLEADCTFCHRSRLAELIAIRTGLAIRELRTL